ncbi:MAG: DmsC/YnfH family molybdoenzyme membrane anchor subunit [Bacteroidales bacterium]
MKLRRKTADKSLSDDVEWSLLIFSFLSVISVSLAIHGSSAGNNISGIIALVLLICGALTSLLHLGRYARAWRSASNILRSPVSREIISMILYGLSLVSALIFPGHSHLLL